MPDTLIYEPKGRAREYAARALNIYRGCDHGCKYCYAPRVLYLTRERFAQSEPRGTEKGAARGLTGTDFLRRLSREAAVLPHGEPILLCFTCDPYQLLDVRLKHTRDVLSILHNFGHAVHVLTKGGPRALRDIDLFTPRDAFATTLTFPAGDDRWREWEPDAAAPLDRYAAIRAFHRRRIPTWVSLEPVLDPDASLQIIRDTHRYVDLFKVGRLNYQAAPTPIDWPAFARAAVALLDRVGARYMLKRDLAACLRREP